MANVCVFPEKLSRKSAPKSRKKKRSTFDYGDNDEDDKFFKIRAPISAQEREDQERASKAAWNNNSWIAKKKAEMDVIEAAAAASAAASTSFTDTTTPADVDVDEWDEDCCIQSDAYDSIANLSEFREASEIKAINSIAKMTKLQESSENEAAPSIFCVEFRY